jgi:RNase P protein component
VAKTSTRAGRTPRKRASSAHFAISSVSQTQRDRPTNTGENSAGESVVQNGHLLMAIPKRLLKRAVDRNTVRRAARQAWQERVLSKRVASTALIRMTAKPADFEQSSRPQRKKRWREELTELMDRYAQQ